MFFERPGSGELAVLVHLHLDSEKESENPREFEQLVLSAGGDPVAFLTGSRHAPHPKYFVGTGKLEELRDVVASQGVQLAVFNHSLSPSQERNLERALSCRVVDRTGLILDIFAQRAKTHEGKLQVELAQLQHMATRLVRGWTHLERQKGGIGLRGPGETQLETDRRLLRARIKSLQGRLDKVRRQRAQNRRARTRAEISTLSLVGYTNAGKSTLFNALTRAGVYASDQLFATLDPTMRRIELAEVGPVIVADTVGFISHLPHKLVEAFRATLEEATSATLLLHVIDAADEDRQQHMLRVDEVLAEIGAEAIPVLRVFNKIDLVDNAAPLIERGADGRAVAVWLSAHTGAGLPLLATAVAELLGDDIVHGRYRLRADQGRLRAQLYQAKAVVSEGPGEDGATIIEVRLAAADLHRLLRAAGLTAEQWRAGLLGEALAANEPSANER